MPLRKKFVRNNERIPMPCFLYGCCFKNQHMRSAGRMMGKRMHAFARALAVGLLIASPLAPIRAGALAGPAVAAPPTASNIIVATASARITRSIVPPIFPPQLIALLSCESQSKRSVLIPGTHPHRSNSIIRTDANRLQKFHQLSISCLVSALIYRTLLLCTLVHQRKSRFSRVAIQ